MTGIETIATNEVAKSATKFIDALLGPKIEQLKKWSTDRELQKIIGTNKLDHLLNDYLFRTIQKASELSTIVFPQSKLKLSDIYEPLLLQEIHMSFTRIDGLDDEDPVEIDLISEGKCYLIIDEAGMGKSTYLKYLTLEAIAKTDRVPILFELATYNKDFSLLENIAKSLDELNRPFDRNLFNHLIVAGKFLIMLDGFDELSGTLQKMLKHEFVEISEKKGKSTLLLSSRPQDNFPNLLQPIRVKINKLTQEQAKSIVLKYDNFSDLDVGKRLIEEFPQIPQRFLETPLLVGLLYRTFGFNNSIAKKVSVFYCEIFDALYKGHDLTKSGYVREKSSSLDIDTFRSLLRTFSFLYILDTAGTHTYESIIKLIQEAQKLYPSKLSSPRNFCEDLLLAVPLITKDGNNYKFMHRTIAEYFAAEYIVNTDKSSTLMRKILENNSAIAFRQTLEFVYEIAPTIYNEVITKPIAESFIKYGDRGCDELYLSVSFQESAYISYWLERDVVVEDSDDRHEVYFPNMPDNIHSFTYLYGDCEGEKYVACIGTYGYPQRIPAAAFLELSAPYKSKLNKATDLWKLDEFNMKELIENLNIQTWYLVAADEIANLSNLHSIEQILLRSDSFLMRNVEDLLVLSVQKSKELIKSVTDLTKAQDALNILLE